MAKAKKTTKAEDSNTPKCTTHQYGDIIHVYDTSGRYKVRYCRHCREHIIISNKHTNEGNDTNRGR